MLLEVLTPIAKSWPSEWCLEANTLAIQVLGGYGYTRDFPVEQYWRDNRLNMIHEGTHGIQALDLLGRKVVMDGGAGLKLLAARIGSTVEARRRRCHGLAEQAHALAAALQRLGAATKAAWATGVPEEALANATPYLQAFGHVVLAWIWLDVALAGPTTRGAAAPRCATSSPTNCPRSTPGWVWWRAARMSAARCRRTGSDAGQGARDPGPAADLRRSAAGSGRRTADRVAFQSKGQDMLTTLPRRAWLLASLGLAALLSACALPPPAEPPPPIVFVHGNGDTAALWATTQWRFESQRLAARAPARHRPAVSAGA